ncbi:MAG TPA: YegS/Rv2252/BmrU family lipid kinase [Acidimicrobiales bacterium]|jgi:YegS/Rv2252/BmrU family lipid kinase|nr:YegS/Rv2252/BmrU family lipid kinase [Acidimicrobiales bacterium]
MTSIAVVAHRNKMLGGGLGELRKVLAEKGFPDPMWFEVTKSSRAPEKARKAVAKGADLLFIWGGDGTVQRCVDAVAGKTVDLAILPAGTANLLARNLEIPIDLEGAVDVGLSGDRRPLDVGVLNGERFAVMAGVGFDAVTMRDADGELKGRFGRVAYVWTGIRATHMKSRKVRIELDGAPWFKGPASCVLLGQMGSLGSGIVAFPDALPDDGLLEVGVVTAENTLQWARVLSRMVVDDAKNSPLAQVGRGRTVDIKLDQLTEYELDGGARTAKKKFHATIEPLAITVLVPRKEQR